MTQILSELNTMNSPENSDIVLSVEGVSKKFCRELKRSLWYGVQDIAKELTGVRAKDNKLRPHEFWALKDIKKGVQEMIKHLIIFLFITLLPSLANSLEAPSDMKKFNVNCPAINYVQSSKSNRAKDFSPLQ